MNLTIRLSRGHQTLPRFECEMSTPTRVGTSDPPGGAVGFVRLKM